MAIDALFTYGPRLTMAELRTLAAPRRPAAARARPACSPPATHTPEGALLLLMGAKLLEPREGMTSRERRAIEIARQVVEHKRHADPSRNAAAATETEAQP
jgi:hypothetical protein